ncbi:MAG: hypothetical protein ABGZ49_13015 [Akkermansiaceae bacterium]
MKTRKWFNGAALLTAGTLAAGMANAELLLLEQFDYEGVNQPLNGFDGGEGFAGPWVVGGWSRNYDIGRTLFAPNPGVSGTTVNDRGGLEFEGLPTAGSALARYGTAGQREAHRELSAEAKAALTADNTTIWFSVLAGAPTGPHKYGTLIFGTDPMLAVPGAGDNANLSSPTGQAFGVGFRSDNGGAAGGGPGSPNAVAFIDSASATVELGSYTPPLPDGATHHDTVLIVGKINWNPNGTEDELFLFNITSVSDPEPAEGDAIASLTADFDQSAFTMIALQDTGATIYDEIRFGTTFNSVLGLVAAVPLQLSINSNGGNLDLGWESKPGMFYVLRSSSDLAADPATWDSVNVAGSVENNGVFEIASSAPLNMHSIARPGDPVRFYRVEEYPLPPVTIFEDNFDGADLGWTTGFDALDTLMNTVWQVGDPVGGPATGPAAANSGPNCYGTNLASSYGISSITWLRSPVIDLTTATGATLIFQQWVDMDEFDNLDHGTVRVLDASALPGTVTELAVLQADITGLAADPGSWVEFSVELPPAALGQTISLEFGFESDGDDIFDASGWYLDDVTVITPAP